MTFASQAEVTRLRTICERVGVASAEIVEVYSPQPLLADHFDAPPLPRTPPYRRRPASPQLAAGERTASGRRRRRR